MHDIVYWTLGSDDPLAIRRVRGLLSLGRSYGPAIAERAAEHVRTLKSSNYYMVKGLCEKLKNEYADHNPLAGQLTQHHDLIRPLTEYDHIINRERNSVCP
jgi:hypothetical protein